MDLGRQGEKTQRRIARLEGTGLEEQYGVESARYLTQEAMRLFRLRCSASILAKKRRCAVVEVGLPHWVKGLAAWSNPCGAAASGGAERRFSAQARQNLSVLASLRFLLLPHNPDPIPRTRSHQTPTRRPGDPITISPNPSWASVPLCLPSSAGAGDVLVARSRRPVSPGPAKRRLPVKAVSDRSIPILRHLVSRSSPLTQCDRAFASLLRSPGASCPSYLPSAGAGSKASRPPLRSHGRPEAPAPVDAIPASILSHKYRYGLIGADTAVSTSDLDIPTTRDLPVPFPPVDALRPSGPP